jgi:hypothetical protein
MTEFYFRSMEASDIESEVTNQSLVGGLDIPFAGIFYVSLHIQKLFKKFMILQKLRKFFSFGGQI